MLRLSDFVAYMPTHSDRLTREMWAAASVNARIANPAGRALDAFRKTLRLCNERRVLVAKAPTLVMNLTVDPSIIAEPLEEDPAAASVEWLGEFRTDVESYASREVVEAGVSPGVRERAPLARSSYVGFVDPSGGASDSMTLAIAHREQSTVSGWCWTRSGSVGRRLTRAL